VSSPFLWQLIRRETNIMGEQIQAERYELLTFEFTPKIYARIDSLTAIGTTPDSWLDIVRGARLETRSYPAAIFEAQERRIPPIVVAPAQKLVFTVRGPLNHLLAAGYSLE
jgi:hypothetical protein